MEVHEWLNDGHKILIVIDGESTHLEVSCPGLNAGHRIEGLKCGMGTDETGSEVENYCYVTEMVAELGMEPHCTALPIMVRGELPIEWGYYSGEGEEFWFKVAGYPSWEEAKGFREEALADLFEGESPGRAKTIARAVALFPLQPWSETDEELKDQTREDIQTYIENEKRKANA